ncbi:Aste57867_9046 [Aphanomyces stellatus]|uniref:Aste57867_9046 protein n=1 Tax=Aphanomyces stellatus TaxID=120398 RepID=A0A485KM09_9STRA|nr:hypothetical protein As57867_009010 [Aphanomyces stellatus]VFT85930.1 Aste57867_9046 [Aphanomyces stellatus]
MASTAPSWSPRLTSHGHRLIRRPDLTAALRHTMARNTHVRLVVAEFAAFDGLPQLLQKAYEFPANNGTDRFYWHVFAVSMGRFGGCPRSLPQLAAFHGHVSISQILRKMNYPIDARSRGVLLQLLYGLLNRWELNELTRVPLLDAICASGQSGVVDVLLRGGILLTADAKTIAAANGHVDVVKVLHKHSSQGLAMWSSMALHEAAVHGQYLVVKYMVDHKVVAPTEAELEAAAAHGHLNIVKYLRDGWHSVWPRPSKPRQKATTTPSSRIWTRGGAAAVNRTH